MTWTRRLINAVRPTTATTRPKPGRILNPRPEDSWRDYPSSNLTPSRLMSVLREADAGSLSAPMQLYEEMEEKETLGGHTTTQPTGTELDNKCHAWGVQVRRSSGQLGLSSVSAFEVSSHKTI